MLSSGSAAAVFRGVVGELATIVEWDEGPGVLLYIAGKMVVSNSLRGPALQG